MKIEIEIPNGAYCNGCPLHVVYEHYENIQYQWTHHFCNLLGVSLEMVEIEHMEFLQEHAVKDSNCPFMKMYGSVENWKAIYEKIEKAKK